MSTGERAPVSLVAPTPEERPRGAAPAARRRRPRGEKRGVALVMVLAAITVLTVFLTELQEETSAELAAAVAERDALRAEYTARSAVNLSRLIIASEPTIRSLIGPMLLIMLPGSTSELPQIPVWQAADMVLGAFNDQAGVAAFGGLIGADVSTAKNMGLGGSHFDVKIVDEDGLFNVNKVYTGGTEESRLQVGGYLYRLMSGEQYNPMFEGRDADNQFSDRATICGALVDWADFDEELFGCDVGSTSNTGSKGVEDSFYQSIGLDYMRKNAAYDSLDELRMVRGMSDDFWSTFVEPDPNNPQKRLLTVWGQNKININTAPPLSLLTIACAEPYGAPAGTPLCTDITQIDAFLSSASLLKMFMPPGVPLFRGPKDFLNALKGKGLVGELLKSLDVPVTPIASFRSERELTKLLDNKSKVFSIYAEGVVTGYKRETRVRIHAVIDTRPPVTQFQGQPLSPTTTPTPTTGASGTAENNPLANNPAGTIIYWRIE